MKKSIRSYFSYAPKKAISAFIILALAIIIPAVAFAWGPSRQTFTTAAPADFVTFNSIVDNPVQGDERNFVQVKASDASNSTYADSISLTAGKKYTVFMYYHNNAASNLNLVATGTYAKAQIPAVVAKGASGVKAVGYIGADNATPKEVWDDVAFSNTTAGDIALRLVPGSAHIYNQGSTNGSTISDSIITTGAPLGFNALDGKLSGCNHYAGYVTFELVADQPNFTISKQVRTKGTTTWSESVNAKADDHVEFQIEYKNTGTTAQNGVVIKDVLQAGLAYVKGSTYLKNASNPNAKIVSDNLVTNSGINIGDYTAGSNAFLKFEAVVGKDIKCGTNTITNTANALTNNGSKGDSANVVSSKTCTDTPGQLPYTGPSDVIFSTLGIGAVVASAAYYVASRKKI